MLLEEMAKVREKLLELDLMKGMDFAFFDCLHHQDYKEDPSGKTRCLVCEKALSPKIKTEEDKLRERLAEIVHYARDRREKARREWLVRHPALTKYREGFLEGLGEALEDVLILFGAKFT